MLAMAERRDNFFSRNNLTLLVKFVGLEFAGGICLISSKKCRR